MKRAVKVGADVPYCVMRGTALAEGIGEKLTRLPRVPHCYVLVGKPGVNVSTKTAYENLKLDDPAVVHPDIDGILAGLKAGDLKKVAGSMGNVLERVTVDAYPVIDQIKKMMIKEGALNAMMSGSGPTVFGIFEEKATARKAADAIRDARLTKQVYVTNIHNARRKR